MIFVMGRCNGTAAFSLSRCISVPSVCFEAEQIILHGTAAEADERMVLSLLNRSRDVLDGISLLHPWVRPTVRRASDGKYRYLPLAFRASQAQRAAHRSRLLMSHRPSRAPVFSNTTALAFASSWSDSFGEVFARVVLRLYELSCGLREPYDVLIPLMWHPPFSFFLEPFGAASRAEHLLLPDARPTLS